MENNLDCLLFSTEEEMIYEIVDNILKTQDKIIEKQNLTKLNNNFGIGKKINEIKKNIENYSNIIHQKISEIKNKENEIIKNKKITENEINNLNKEINKIEDNIKKIKNSSNNEDFYKMSYEKIEELIMNDGIRLESFQQGKKTLKKEKNLTNLNNEKNKVIESLLMLKEEKNSINFYLFNVVSEKESLEENLKIILFDCIDKNKIKNKNIKNLNKKISNFLNENNIKFDFNFKDFNLDFEKCSSEISNLIINFINENDFEENSNQMKNINNILIMFFQNNFIKFNKNNIQNYLNELSLNLIKNFNLPFLQNKFSNFLKYFLKFFILEKIIENYIEFLDKNYKTTKKHLNKLLKEIDFNINKINTNNQGYESESNSNLLQNNNKILFNLAPEIREYLLLSEKSIRLQNNKKDLEEDLEEKIINYKMLKEENNNIVFDLEIKIKNFKYQIEQLNNQFNKEKHKLNKEIKNLFNSISEKFKMIKTQLFIYKIKHGDNLDLYDKLVKHINNTLKNPNINLTINDTFNSSILQTPISSYKNNISNRFLNKNILFNLDSLSSHNSIFSFKHLNNNSMNILLNSYSLPIYNNYMKSRNSFSLKNKNKIKLNLENNSLSSNNIMINKNKNNFNKKFSLLCEGTFCYFRLFNVNNLKFNPLINNVSDKDFYKFQFKKGEIKLYKNELQFVEDNNKIFKIINISNIHSNLVNNNIKYLIKIYQCYKNEIKNKKNVNFDNFINNKKFKDIPFNKNDIIKAAQNNLFNFIIVYNENNELNKIEVLFNNYKDIKLWLNNLNYLKKNKDFIENNFV